MKSARILRQRIQSQELTLGMIVTNHLWPELVEIARNAGLDYLIVDLEHNDFGGELVNGACALGRLLDFPILIRPPETQYSYVRRAADAGACGFLLPQVRSVAMIEQVQQGLHMPPRGLRRPGGPGNRWVSDFNYPSWREHVEDEFIVVPQIESREGLGNVEAIAAHPIVTAIGIGPYDLSAELGVCWQPNHPDLLAAQERIREAGRKAGKNMWMIGDGATLMGRGFSFLCVGEPMNLLESVIGQNVKALRSGERPAGEKMHKVD